MLKVGEAKPGDRVAAEWLFKADGSFRNGTVTCIGAEYNSILFDDGRHEWILKSTFQAHVSHLYDQPQPAPLPRYISQWESNDKPRQSDV